MIMGLRPFRGRCLGVQPVPRTSGQPHEPISPARPDCFTIRPHRSWRLYLVPMSRPEGSEPSSARLFWAQRHASSCTSLPTALPRVGSAFLVLTAPLAMAAAAPADRPSGRLAASAMSRVPRTGQATTAIRRSLHIEDQLPVKDGYRALIAAAIVGAGQV
jgi:hypothetical protein